MRIVGFARGWILAILLVLALNTDEVFACATCFGKSDSPLAKGMNMGIFSLLGVIGFVLCGVAGFFVFLARRSARVHGQSASTDLAQSVTRF